MVQGGVLAIFRLQVNRSVANDVQTCRQFDKNCRHILCGKYLTKTPEDGSIFVDTNFRSRGARLIAELEKIGVACCQELKRRERDAQKKTQRILNSLRLWSKSIAVWRSFIWDGLVSVMLRLVWAFDRNVDVIGLFLGQHG